MRLFSLGKLQKSTSTRVLYIVNLRNLQAEGVTEAEARYPAV